MKGFFLHRLARISKWVAVGPAQTQGAAPPQKDIAAIEPAIVAIGDATGIV